MGAVAREARLEMGEGKDMHDSYDWRDCSNGERGGFQEACHTGWQAEVYTQWQPPRVWVSAPCYEPPPVYCPPPPCPPPVRIYQTDCWGADPGIYVGGQYNSWNRDPGIYVYGQYNTWNRDPGIYAYGQYNGWSRNPGFSVSGQFNNWNANPRFSAYGQWRF